MRIGSVSQVAQIYQTQTKAANKAPAYESQMDAYSVSSKGKDYQVAKTALASTPDVREDKVAEIKASIENGTYNVSVDDFAAKLLSAYENRTV
ncbi:MAG: flagellar biosynthesis anti-sigma factor FlgM [Lachnospiraceae bacterium]|nr:flagellar biosynthesis anti-sigma factor FlgM [Lachnospiraceae bacterium]